MKVRDRRWFPKYLKQLPKPTKWTSRNTRGKVIKTREVLRDELL